MTEQLDTDTKPFDTPAIDPNTSNGPRSSTGARTDIDARLAAPVVGAGRP